MRFNFMVSAHPCVAQVVLSPGAPRRAPALAPTSGTAINMAGRHLANVYMAVEFHECGPVVGKLLRVGGRGRQPLTKARLFGLKEPPFRKAACS